MYKSYGLLVFFLVIMAQWSVCPSIWAGAAGDPYTLTIEGKGICNIRGFIDHQDSHASIPLVIPKGGGKVMGNGTYTIQGTGYSLAGNVVIQGVAEHGMLTFPYPDYYYNGTIMSKISSASPIQMKIEAGSEYSVVYPECNMKVYYRLIGPSETWQAVYNGYTVLYIGTNDQAGGVKVYWRTTIEFAIENGKYKSGRGTNTIDKYETYSFPPGVWDCVILTGYPKIETPIFNVPGTKNGDTVQLTLPKKDNGFFISYNRLMDTEALKSYYMKKGYNKFPSLAWIEKNRTIRDQYGIFPEGFHNVTLANYEKIIEKDTFQGLSVKVKKK